MTNSFIILQLASSMPELPEVENYRRYFQRHALRRKISGVSIQDPGVLAEGTSPHRLTAELVGRRFDAVSRHGKNLFGEISRGGGYLRIHFGMTGDLKYYKEGRNEPRFARVVVHFAEGAHLAYVDSRKFGRIELLADAAAYLRDRGIGPDPLSEEFNAREFAEAIAKRRGAIKPMLMNQRVLAGVGNLYADEALFQAGIHPLSRVEELGIDELVRVIGTLRRVLERVTKIQAKDHRYPRSFLLPKREEDESCPRCGARIARATVGGRTTYFCPRHQRR